MEKVKDTTKVKRFEVSSVFMTELKGYLEVRKDREMVEVVSDGDVVELEFIDFLAFLYRRYLRDHLGLDVDDSGVEYREVGDRFKVYVKSPEVFEHSSSGDGFHLVEEEVSKYIQVKRDILDTLMGNLPLFSSVKKVYILYDFDNDIHIFVGNYHSVRDAYITLVASFNRFIQELHDPDKIRRLYLVEVGLVLNFGSKVMDHKFNERIYFFNPKNFVYYRLNDDFFDYVNKLTTF